MVRKMRQTYRVSLELDTDTDQWMADVDGLPVHTWAPTLGKAKQYAEQALALHLNEDVTAVRSRLRFRDPQFPADVAKAVRVAAQTSEAAKAARMRAAAAKVQAARALVDQAHLSKRDAGDVLGVSHQRVQQLMQDA